MAVPLTALGEHRVAAADGNAARSQKLAKSAREFEAMLLTSWLEKMNQSFSGVEHSEDAAHDTLSSLGTQAIAGAIAARGGVGIADLILRKLQLEPARKDAGPSTPNREAEALPSTAIACRNSHLRGMQTLKSSQELPITKLQGNGRSEVQR